MHISWGNPVAGKTRFALSYGMFAAIAAGFFMPPFSVLTKAIPFLLGIMLFNGFLKFNFRTQKFFRRELLLYLPVVFFIVPAAVYFLTSGMPLEVRAGFLILSVTPTAIGAQVIAELIGGDVSLVLSDIVVANFLAPVIYTLMLYLFFSRYHVAVPMTLIFSQVALILLIPLACSLIVKRFVKIKTACVSASKYFNPAALIAVIFSAVSSASAKIHAAPNELLLRIGICAAIIAALNFLLGFAVSRSSKLRRSYAVMFGHKNTAIGIFVALTAFGPLAAVPIVLYIILHHIANGILINRYGR